jgi:steroid Delta-isomerase
MSAAADAFAAHCSAWNAGDRAAWLTLFADDVTLEDPVGAVAKVGLDALHTTWERSQRPDRQWRLVPRRVVDCGEEVAIDLVNVGRLDIGGPDEREVTVESIEIWRVNPAGLVTSVRTFFAADPTVNDPYYLPT